MRSAPSSWRWLWRYLVAAAVILWLAVRTFAHDDPAAPLTMLELGIHESSHMAFIWAPTVVYFLAGTAGQILVPLAIGAYLLVRMRDPLGGAVGLAWSGLSCHGAAVYIADAPYERLQLVGGNTHDWAYLLGPEQFDALGSAATVAGAVRTTGILMVAAAMVICVVMPALALRDRPERPRPGALRWSAPD